MGNQSDAPAVRSIVEKHEIICQFFYFRKLFQSMTVVLGNPRDRRKRTTIANAYQDAAEIESWIFSSNINRLHFEANRLCLSNELWIEYHILINERFTSFHQALPFLIRFRLLHWRCAALKKCWKGCLQVGFVKRRSS